MEITGYSIKRDEFEPEYDNEAEFPLGELEIKDDDAPADKEMKLKMLSIYYRRLQERYKRRDFILNRGLLNVKKQQTVEKKRRKEENELHASMRVFARFQSQEDHEELVEGILKEQRLRQRIEELKEYRRMGISTLVEAELYEQDKRRRDSERQKMKSPENYLQQPAFKSSSAMRANRYLNRAASDGKNQAVASGSSRELQSLRLESNNNGEAIPNNIAFVRKKQVTPADFSNTPGLNFLSLKERELCSSLRLLPSHYLSIKADMLIHQSNHGSVSKQDARDMAKVDSYKLTRVHEFLIGSGLISES